MKTIVIILTAFALLLFVPNTFAQKGFNLGLCLEVHSSMGGDFQVPTDLLSSNPGWINMDKDFRAGADLGLDGEYFFNDQTGLALGIHYVNLGVKFKDYTWSYAGASATLAKKIELNYVRIPVLFLWRNKLSDKLNFEVQGGIYFGILSAYHDESTISGNNGTTVTYSAEGDTYMRTDYSSGGQQTSTATFTSKPFESSDVGGIIAAGLQFKLSEKIWLPFLLNYQVGFTNVKNKSSSYNYQGTTYVYWDDGIGNRPNLSLDYKNSSIGIKTGLIIKL